MQKGEDKLRKTSPPDFGFKEGDLLRMRESVQQLSVSNNNMAKEIEGYRKIELVSKTQESHWMLGVLLRQIDFAGRCIAILADALDKKGMLTDDEKGSLSKYIPSDEKIKEMSKEYQSKDLGLKSKQEGLPVEQGDVMILGYRLYKEEGIVDDKMGEEMGYEVGSNGLGIDDGLIGMVVGETRYFDVNLKEGLVSKELADQDLKMHVLCKGIKIRNGANAFTQESKA